MPLPREHMKLIKDLFRIARIAKGKGISPGGLNAKMMLPRLIDLLRWYILHHEVLQYYYVFEFHCKNWTEQDQYQSWIEHAKVRDKVNENLVDNLTELDYRILAYDKFVANNYLASVNIPCAQNLALIKKHQILWVNGDITDLKKDTIMETLDGVVIKPVLGMGGKGVMCIDGGGSILDEQDRLLSTLS